MHRKTKQPGRERRKKEEEEEEGGGGGYSRFVSGTVRRERPVEATLASAPRRDEISRLAPVPRVIKRGRRGSPGGNKN